MHSQLLEQICEETRAGRSGILCILVAQEGSSPRHSGASMWVRYDGSIEGTIGGGVMEFSCIEHARAMLDAGTETSFKRFDLAEALTGVCPEGGACGGAAQVYFERVGPQDEIVIFGAGHVGKALAHLATITGYRVTVWDERAEYANDENIPWAHNVACPLNEFLGERFSMHKGVYAVVVTRGHTMDYEVMKGLEGQEAAYIGVIGSRSKIKFVEGKLRKDGVSEAHLDRMHRPIGLPIGAETPEEIAVSILSEIIALKRGANLPALRAAR